MKSRNQTEMEEKMYSKKSGKSMFKKFLCTVGSVAFMALFAGLTVEAKTVEVKNGDIQSALSQAQSESEVLTVVIPSGEYNISGVLYVFSNTVIEAKGAKITSTANVPGQPLLTSLEAVSNVTVHGGEWGCDAWSPIQFKGIRDAKFDEVTVNTKADYCINLSKDSSNVTIQNSTLQGGGINAESSSDLKILSNKIDNATKLGIRVAITGNNLIQGNTVTNSGRTGIQLEYDTKSTIHDNTIIGSALTGVKGDHGEGLVVMWSEGTTVTSNKIIDTHSNVVDNGNGIIVAYSNNVVIDDNDVMNSGNHGIQVCDNARAVTVSNNRVSGSGRMGMSISRGAEVNLIKNTISASKVNGIVFDGHDGTCSGTIEGDTIRNTQGSGAGDAGIWIGASNVTVQNVNVADGAGFGMLITQGSTVTAKNNYIYQTGEAPDGFGVIVNGNSTAEMNGNRISNFGKSGIQVDKATVNATNNTVTTTNPAGFKNNAINNPGTLMNNTLKDISITTNMASGSNYFDGVEAGVVINGTLTNLVIPQGSGGKFAVEYPAQANTNDIVLYVKNTDGNVICVNAPIGFTLDGAHEEIPDDMDVEQVEKFVTRLYRNTLNREPDEKGLEDWINRLASGKTTGAEAAYGFFFSKEFIAKGIEDGEYVDLLYQTMFGTPGDDAGREMWRGELKTGFSREYVYHGFAESPQFQNLCKEYGIQSGNMVLTEARDLNRNVTQFVSRNYTEALHRTPDVGGLNDWCGWILNKTYTPEKVVDYFIFSPEFEKKGLSNEEFVNVLYATYFGRAADSEGFETWVNMLANGASRRTVVDGFSGSKEFHRLVAKFNLPQ